MEVWKDIEGYEGYYQVSDLGRVKAFSRLVGHPNGGLKRLPEKIMNMNPSKSGYIHVNLRGRGRKVFSIHRLVALHFIPNPENKPEVNHKDGVKTNNHKSNLEWSTNQENITHSWETGLNNHFGEKHPNSKFTESQILEIRENKNNLTQRELGEIYGTCQGVISKIMLKTRWKHI